MDWVGALVPEEDALGFFIREGHEHSSRTERLKFLPRGAEFRLRRSQNPTKPMSEFNETKVDFPVESDVESIRRTRRLLEVKAARLAMAVRKHQPPPPTGETPRQRDLRHAAEDARMLLSAVHEEWHAKGYFDDQSNGAV